MPQASGGLRLASWNVESIRAHHDQVIAWVEANQPDVVCLQETKVGARLFPRHSFEALGYEVVTFGGDDGTGGVALASRLPLDDVVLGIQGAVTPLNEPRAIAATVDGIRVHNVYAPNGRKVGTQPHQVKLAWFTLLAAWLESERAHLPNQILIGDLNIAPLDIDVWDASRYRKRNLTSPPERAAFARLLDGGELIDVVRVGYEDRAAFTWWNRRSDFFETDRGWRLDHILATPDIAQRVTHVAIDRAERARIGSTDHAPLVVDLAAS